ncbi:hypothetical protein AB6H17_07290 [Proteus vulgaris]|uniref:hypothetical protein n=1 Tax=Proteus vulgaris TaxID=585 RepID=UPI0034DD1822
MVLWIRPTGWPTYARQNIPGSRYFIEKAPIPDYDQLERRTTRSGNPITIEIPPKLCR